MINVLYIDAFSGVAGDMLLAGLFDLGVDVAWLGAELRRLPIGDISLSTSRVTDRGLSARHLDLGFPEEASLRHLPDILSMIASAGYSPKVTAQASEAFRRIAAAEAQVHGSSIDKVHFHEVGALDTIIDIVGFFLALESLEVHHVVCSPLPMPSGHIQIAHGLYPLPAPAVPIILAGVPVYGVSESHEMVTPTGAALAVVAADSFGEWPSMVLHKIGFGAGQPGKGSMPNVVRLALGQAEGLPGNETVVVLETQIDDMSSEFFGFVGSRLLAAGALDYYMIPIYMKKSRPAVLLSVIAPVHLAESLASLVLTETTTSGVRRQVVQRWTLPRRMETVQTEWGAIAVKVFTRPDGSLRAAPEYEDCARIAAEVGLPLQTVYLTALQTWQAGAGSTASRPAE